MQTPQRPLPGAYSATPVTARMSGALPPRQPLFGSAQTSSVAAARNPSQPSQPGAPSQGSGQAPSHAVETTLTPVERAAKSINDTLSQEARYPELDNYVIQGISSVYDVSSSPSWAPFHKTKVYPIPDKIFEQYNRAQVSTMMGLFAEINHAWVSIDNALYLWDYTHPDPALVGYEDQPNSITAVRLVVPRKDVFISTINRLLLIATTVEIILVGMSIKSLTGGGHSVALYQTKMAIPVRGLDVTCTASSAKTGRIFFSGTSDYDVYEITYQQEEKWFFSRCRKVNQTTGRLAALKPTFNFSATAPPESTVQMALDDSRQLLYTLSSDSAIRVFHMQDRYVLKLVINKPLREILNHIGHMISQTELISTNTKIVAIHPITSREASKLHLMATTSTGCRIFLSATTSFGYLVSDASNAPTSMQVHHVKFPPSTDPGSPMSNALTQPTPSSATNTSSKSFITTRSTSRNGPGFFFCFVSRNDEPSVDQLFVSGPDTGRIVRPQDPASLIKYPELGMWISLGSRAEDIGLITEPFAAAETPQGFANELAVQYDKPTTEVAILTNTGIHTLRRQRLVDMFVTALRVGGNREGLEGIVRRFIHLYGRGETTATALAVACGQGLDVSSDYRTASITDPMVIEQARTAFIEYGGKPQFNENTIVDHSGPTADAVKPSPRYDGLAMYLSRLIRSFWKAKVIKESVTPAGGLEVTATVDLDKLRDAQQDLTKLKEFLEANKNFIDGLAGPEALGRVSTRKEEIALQAEHRALHSLITLISSTIEGISFVQVLFAERMEEIVLSLTQETRKLVKEMSYESLFSTAKGKDLAKELVKAIVNRNIVNGANVDTVADALRRRCGSFCSAADVIVFKAQEQLKRAAEAGSATEFGRNLLNESLRLFKEVTDSLSPEQLQGAVEQYISMQFYAGAIELALNVAHELDRGNRALIWIQNGRPEQDSGAVIFTSRKRCYDLVHRVITSLDEASRLNTDARDEEVTLASKRRKEAYEVIDSSEDEVFQTDLYDWYLAQGQANRLLMIQSPYIVTYLRRKFLDDITIADLLWRYHSQANQPHDAATVQLELAQSDFPLSLDRRIEYLSRAKANASTGANGFRRESRQRLLTEISELLDLAVIQDDVMQKFRDDPRISEARMPSLLEELNNKILPLNMLFNNYVDQAGYHDIALLVYQIADHRNPTDIRDTWRNLLDKIHTETVDRGQIQPYEAVADQVRRLGTRLNLSRTTFPVSDLIYLLKRYSFEYQRGVGPATWVMDIFIDLNVSFDAIFPVLEGMLYNNEAPFQGANRRYVADDMLYVAQKWFQESNRGTARLFGSESNTVGMLESLQTMMSSGLSADKMDDCRALRMRIDQILR